MYHNFKIIFGKCYTSVILQNPTVSTNSVPWGCDGMYVCTRAVELTLCDGVPQKKQKKTGGRGHGGSFVGPGHVYLRMQLSAHALIRDLFLQNPGGCAGQMRACVSAQCHSERVILKIST